MTRRGLFALLFGTAAMPAALVALPSPFESYVRIFRDLGLRPRMARELAKAFLNLRLRGERAGPQ